MVQADLEPLSLSMYQLIEELYPICRSITGDGVRETLRLVGERIPLQVCEVPSGTQVFDWVVPKEWNIRDAYIKNQKGERIVDFNTSNLHVVNYSTPVHEQIDLTSLRPHLFSLPDHPDWIPYRTSYYNENWGFCLSHNQLESMADGIYEIKIDSSLEEGSLTYAECFFPGEQEEEILFYTHICHPSLCNDNLSGIALLTHLAGYLQNKLKKYSYRFVFAPGTIGAITWLSQNEQKLSNIKQGLVIALVGDPGHLTYKKSRQEDTEIDRVVAHVLSHSGHDYEIQPFSPYGYDERQFCSPGINLPIGRLTRSPNGAYSEYHSSADNLELVKPEYLAESLGACFKIVQVIENNGIYINTSPNCEPQLGKRGLYRKTGGEKDIGLYQTAILWILNQSDGSHSLLDIAERAKIEFEVVRNAAEDLIKSGLLKSQL